MNVDPLTGEIINQAVAVKTDKAPAIVIDVTEVAVYHKDPLALAKKIEDQAGFAVFDIGSKKGRDECRSHAANIIKCIAPAHKESTRLAEEAKAVVKQDLAFRKTFEERVREIAAFHRQPLTEWEAEQERIEQERIEAENARLAAEQYLKDWQEALDYDELFTLRKIKQEEERRILAEKEAESERLRIEARVAKRLIEELERAETNRLQEEKLKQDEADRIARENEQARIAAENAKNVHNIEIKQDPEEIPEFNYSLPESKSIEEIEPDFKVIAPEKTRSIFKEVEPIIKGFAKVQPNKQAIIELIADYYCVKSNIAEQWIIDAFSEI